MKIIRKVEDLLREVDVVKKNNLSIGLVPTMGALHAGHMSLIERARAENGVVIVSVFVNPTQFNNPNDLATYPRTEEADCDKLDRAVVDLAFIPTVEEIYPEPDTRQFELGEVAEVMEGAMRPGHFNGVAQIVSKLFAWTRPNRAYFGEKDFQQIAVIRKMAQLENFDIDIVACPIKRESDGLAMSSRNVRLTKENRPVAPNIARILHESIEFAKTHSVKQTQEWVTDNINSYPQMEVEYYQIVDAETMRAINDWKDVKQAVGCVTVFLGDVRLIDNIKYPQNNLQ